MVSFENFVKSMPPSLSELKVIPSFCFAFKIPDDVNATTSETPSLLLENDRKWLYPILSIKYEPKTPSVEMTCDLGIYNKIQAVFDSNNHWNQNCIPKAITFSFIEKISTKWVLKSCLGRFVAKVIIYKTWFLVIKRL